MSNRDSADGGRRCLFKVGLTVYGRDRLAHCVGLGVGPCEIEFREWLHKRIMLSRMPLLWAQVEPLQWQEGRDLERQLHLLIYASGCSPRRQVFWSSGATPADAAERFLQSVVAGDDPSPHAGSALLLAGRAVADMGLQGGQLPVPVLRPVVAQESRGQPPAHRSGKGYAVPWVEVFASLLGVLRRKLAFLWMW